MIELTVRIPTKPQGQLTLEISHSSPDNLSLLFTGRHYGRNILVDPGMTIFEFINKYLQALPTTTTDTMYHMYRDILTTLTGVTPRHQETRELTKLCTGLLDIIDMDHLTQWVYTEVAEGRITIPASVKDEYPVTYDQDCSGSRKQTYIFKEYIPLLAMSMVLRLLIPVWSEYIIKYRDQFGKLYKEYFAFSLITGSKLVTDPDGPYSKLLGYVTHIVNNNLGTDKVSSRVLQGISETDMPEWVMRALMVRRLPGVNLLEHPTTKASPITAVHGYISQQVSPNPNASSTIKRKNPSSYGAEGDDRTSVMENYKLSSRYPLGTIIELEEQATRTRELYRALVPKGSIKTLNELMAHSHVLRDAPISPVQLQLCKWVIGGAYPAEGTYYVSKDHLVMLLVVAQAVLWVKGFQYLSMFLTAVEDPDIEQNTVYGHYQNTVTSKELMERLHDAYPHQRIKVDRKQNISPVMEAINTLYGEITDRRWVLTVPDSYVLELYGELNRRPLSPADLKLDICELLLGDNKQTH